MKLAPSDALTFGHPVETAFHAVFILLRYRNGSDTTMIIVAIAAIAAAGGST